MSNEEWIAGFQLLLVFLIVIGVLFLLDHDIKSEHIHCVNVGGQWVHGIGTDGIAQFYCINPPGM